MTMDQQAAMERLQDLYREKNEYLEEFLEWITPYEFYREVFPVGSFERRGHFEDAKGNGIAVTIPKGKAGAGGDGVTGVALEIEGNGKAKRYTITDELAELRYRASIQPGFQESFAAMFPAPRQRWVDALASDYADIMALPHDTLIIHGRDDQVIPPDNALRLNHLISRSQLHLFGRCGHWVQIEHAARFNRLVGDFLAEN